MISFYASAELKRQQKNTQHTSSDMLFFGLAIKLLMATMAPLVKEVAAVVKKVLFDTQTAVLVRPAVTVLMT